MAYFYLALILLSGCVTEEKCPACPVCVDTSLAEQEVCDIEKAEINQKYQDCLDGYYRSEMLRGNCEKLHKKNLKRKK